MASEIKIGIIGLDTSHTIQFTKLIQGDAPPENKIEGMRVVKAMRFPSPFQAEDGQDERQKQLEGWGVTVGTSLEEAVDGMDAIFLEINDPALHLEYFEKIASLGKPVFLDKPLAGTVVEGKKILALAREHNTTVWSASSLRFIKQLVAARAKMPEPLLVNTFGPLGKAPAGSSLIWYGVHTVEMLNAAMGSGARQVHAIKDEQGVVMAVDYGNGRRGIAECNQDGWLYGGRMQTKEEIIFFEKGDDVLYYELLLQVKSFLENGDIPVTMDDSLEILAILEAAEKSIQSGKPEPLAL